MLDPRTKLVMAFSCGVVVVVLNRLEWLAALWAGLLTLVLLTRHSSAYGRWLCLVLPMSLFFGAVTVWSFDWITGITASLKLLTLTSAFFIFFMTTPPEDLGNALVKAGLPYTAAFVMSASVQFVPIIGRKAKSVLDAQRARGIPIEPGWKALRHYPAFFLPLLLQCFQLAEELAESMEARGFSRKGRTFLKSFRLKSIDLLIIWICFLSLSGYLIWWYMNG